MLEAPLILTFSPKGEKECYSAGGFPPGAGMTEGVCHGRIRLFGFYSPELEGFSGIGHSVEDCLYKAKWGMKEHVSLLEKEGLPVPPATQDPEITIQNEKKKAAAA